MAGMIGVILIGILGVLVVVGLATMITYRKVSQGQVLIVNTPWSVKVHFTGGFVIPVFTQAEIMDISVKTIRLERSGKDGLICADNIRADIMVTFFVMVNRTNQDVRKVAQAVGCERASDQDRLEELFTAKFSEALKTVGKELEFEELYSKRVEFRDQIIAIIGEDLNGYILEDAAIDYLEQTPSSSLDPDNVLDSRGLEKITEITAHKRVLKNELENKAKKDIGRDDLETKKALLEYARQQADAEARQEREIAVVRAQQKAESDEVSHREIARAQKAEIEAQEEVKIRMIESKREQEVADKNRQRVLAVEEEAVTRERDLQVVERERETALKRMERDREVETEQKHVAEVRRDRIAVDKTVAEEEENIETLRRIKGAQREKDASVIAAEGKAEEALIADIKKAEAQEKVAQHEAREKVIRADADVDAAERTARAKKQLAEGTQAEEAASGLARVQVAEAEAQAIEKQGMVDAKVTREKMLAEAAGSEEKGMADVRVKDKNAEVIEKEGTAHATVTEKQGRAAAVSMREQKEAEAAGILARGKAEANSVREHLLAEAEGLVEKARAIEGFGQTALSHEEYRLQLELQEKLGLKQLSKSVEIARAQADVLSEAMKAANINIVGGNDGFYEGFIRSISAGHMIEGFMGTSPTAGRLVDSLVGKARGNSGGGEGSNGKADTVASGFGGETGKTLSDILNAVRGEADGEGKETIDRLIGMVQDTKLDRLDGDGSGAEDEPTV